MDTILFNKVIWIIIKSYIKTRTIPYEVSTSAYTLTFKEATFSGAQYFAFKANEAGQYMISSLSQDKLALNLVDPYIGFMGATLDLGSVDESANKDSNKDINFKHAFTAEANTTYYFVVFVTSAQKFDASFNINISKA